MSDPTTGSMVSAPAEPAVVETNTVSNESQPAKREKPRGLLGDAWYELRRKPMFWVSAALILVFLLMALFPWLFTSRSPEDNSLSRSLLAPSGDAWFGYDIHGRDVYTRVIYGARASMIVAVIATLGTVISGGLLGMIAGYFGRWVDAVLSRVADVFFGLPFVLGAIVILTTFNGPGSDNTEFMIILLVIASLIALGWPLSMRIMRSAVLSTKQADYITAARALGASNGRIIAKHLLPNTVAPVLVYATILVGSFIGAEATLSFLGVGLRSPVVSWGIMVSEAQNFIRVAPHLLLFPAAFLVTAVLSFVMLGEAVREAFDPKLR